MFQKIRKISYDAATFHGRGFDARYSTDTGIELRIRSDFDGLEPEALAAVDTESYARLWGLASFGIVFAPLLPVRLDVKALSLEPEEEERWRAWFLGTLLERFHLGGLPAELDLTFSGERLAPRSDASRLDDRAILMSGGGKDSAVSGELLKSLGIPFAWFASERLVKNDPAVREVARISGDVPLIKSALLHHFKAPGDAAFKKAKPRRLRRRYLMHRRRYRSPRWPSLMRQTVEACLVGEATASRHVLIGNERSANEGNGVRIGDLEVNHQYAKSYALEREIAPFLAKYLHPDLQFASLLMPFYELQLGKIFASFPQYFSAFNSCNQRTAERPWCLACPKCAFVFLLMAAFVDEKNVSQVFETDLLAEPGLVKTFMALCGLGRHKPFECVGHAEESLLALHLASKRRTATPLHPDLAAILPSAETVEELERKILHAYNEDNGLPPHWNEQLRKRVE